MFSKQRTIKKTVGLILLCLLAGFNTQTSVAATTEQPRSGVIAPGDPRFTKIMTQLLSLGTKPIFNDPSCPGVDPSRKQVGLNEALSGALARESADGKPILVSLTCANIPAPNKQECRFTLGSTDPDAESSSGVTFELNTANGHIAPSSLRCTVTP